MNEQRKKWIFLGCVVLLCGIFYFMMPFDSAQKNESETESVLDNLETKENKEKSAKVYIHICGAIKRPDVYEFDCEPRLVDVIKKAGGFTKKADRDSINQAQILTDGTRIEIKKKENASKQKVDGLKSEKSSLVNINEAKEEVLMTLPGIGQAKAAQIIAYRDEKGNFIKKEDIMNISGIKEGVYSKIKDLITV